MTRKEALYNLVAGREAEGVIFAPILMHFAARQIGKTYGEFASDHRVLARANIHAVREFGMDMASLISDPYRETSAFGAEIEFIDEGVPRCLTRVINSPVDIRNLDIPDLYNNYRTLDRINGAKELSGELGNEVSVGGWIEGPLAEASDLAGVSEMLLMLMMDPENANLLMDKCVLVAKNFAKAQIDAGCDLIGIGDAICSQIDLDTYNRFILERHADIISFIHDQGALVKLHICGDITHLLPSIKETGADIVDFDWQVDLNEGRKILGPETILCGNINPVLIQDKTAGEVYTITKELLAKEKGNRFIMSAGCEIPVNTPPENLLAMSKAVKDFS